MEKKAKLETIKTLEFGFAEKPFHHKYAMSASDIRFAYEPGDPLIRDFSLNIGARDRVFVVGRNGKGKTTLLKILAGALTPQRGEVTMPQSVAMAYFEQTNVSTLVDSNTVLDEISSADVSVEPKLARLIAGAMMFEGDDALKPIRVLSGGEKSRVMLGKIIATPVNLLLLDEPTNHLDIESNDALLEAIDAFDGAVIMVTHNERFLHALAERLIIFQNDDVMIYEGGYQRFLDKIGWRDDEDRPARPTSARNATADGSAKAPAPREKTAPREMRKLRSELVAERSRALKPLEKRMLEIEKAVEKNDGELQRMNQAIVEASTLKDGSRVVELSKAMHQSKADTDLLLEELETITREHEILKSDYESRLSVLEKDGDPPAGET
ncbi:MAG: ATP-binding cassette domain-containing protein, partial [Candidatus Aminicenantales bacterium]